MKENIIYAFSIIGGFISSLIGGFDIVITTLIIFMTIDIITGIILAGVFKNSPKTDSGKINSQVIFKGIFKKIGVILCIIVSTYLDKISGGNTIRHIVCFWFIASEGISILENLGSMGVPIPQKLKDALEVLKGE